LGRRLLHHEIGLVIGAEILGLQVDTADQRSYEQLVVAMQHPLRFFDGLTRRFDLLATSGPSTVGTAIDFMTCVAIMKPLK
jgi:hypothetical protein